MSNLTNDYLNYIQEGVLGKLAVAGMKSIKGAAKGSKAKPIKSNIFSKLKNMKNSKNSKSYLSKNPKPNRAFMDRPKLRLNPKTNKMQKSWKNYSGEINWVKPGKKVGY